MTLDDLIAFFDGLDYGWVTLGKTTLSNPRWYCFVSAQSTSGDYMIYVEGRGSTAEKAARRCYKAFIKETKNS